MCTIVTAARLLNGGAEGEQEIENPAVVISEDGRIAALGAQGAVEVPAGARALEFPGATLAPAFLDVHIHGSAGHDVMDADSGSMNAISRALAGRGVGGWLPTTVTASIDRTLSALDALAKQFARAEAWPGARPLGIHLEGPFLSHAKRGVHPPEYLQPPSVELFDRFRQAAQGHIRLLTVAPELPGAEELIRRATSLGVRCSLGHSDATAAETRAGIHAGAVSATHTFNAMRRLDHRDPGIAGVVLSDDSLFAEIICDGFHVDPVMVQLFYRAKGPRRALLVTDGISATGMPDGIYSLGGLEVEVSAGRCLYRGVIAGSVLTLDAAVRNLVAFTGAPWRDAVRLASANPAEMAGFAADYGALAVGRRADIVVLSPEGEIRQTLLGGIALL